MSAPWTDGNSQLELQSSSVLPGLGIRVLHLINGEHYAGAERVQDLLALRLKDEGFEVGFVCLKPGQFATMRQSQDAPLFDVPMRSRFDLKAARHVARLVRHYDYQLIHTHTARSALVGRLAAAKSGVPHVHHLHSPAQFDSTRWVTNRVNMLIEKYSLRHAAAMIAVSRSLGTYAEQHHLSHSLLTVVPNGVPTRGPLVVRPTPSDTWTIGCVALFRPRKGIEVLLAALAQLRAQGLPVRLRAVGAFESSDYEAQVKALSAQLGLDSAVDWVGFCRDVPAEMAHMDLFVLPSLFGEGLPMVILEAMAAGVPVVGTRVEGVPEMLCDESVGLIAEPNDPADLARQMAVVVKGEVDWQRLRGAAHWRQAELFSDVSMASQVADVYRTVLEQVERPSAPSLIEVLQAEDSATQDISALSDQDTSNEHGVVSSASVCLLGTRIDNLHMSEAIELITDRLKENAPTQICFVNADCLNLTYRDAEYRETLANADLVFPDGVGLKIAGKVLGQPVADNVNGTDLFPRLCWMLSGSETRIYLLGGKPGVAVGVGRWIQMHFPGIEVVGTRDGYFAPHEEGSVVRDIAAREADLLLVALGAPRQDNWIRYHLADLNCRVVMGVGGLFDFYSGQIPRAPHWMRANGLEWLYRFCQEPRRLANRYLLGNPLFLFRVARERFLRRHQPPKVAFPAATAIARKSMG